MVKLMTEPDLDATQVEDVAHAIYRAELLCLYPQHAAASAPVDSRYWQEYWGGQTARTRASYRQQAIAALRASKLLERVVELETEIRALRPDGFKDGPCPFEHAHTRHWCGYRDCRDA